MDQYLSPEVFHFDCTTLKSHHETGGELVLSTLEFGTGDRRVEEETELMNKAGENLAGSATTCNPRCSRKE